jgi:hypothetical protein
MAKFCLKKVLIILTLIFVSLSLSIGIRSLVRATPSVGDYRVLQNSITKELKVQMYGCTGALGPEINCGYPLRETRWLDIDYSFKSIEEADGFIRKKLNEVKTGSSIAGSWRIVLTYKNK